MRAQVSPQGVEIDVVEEVLEMLAYLTYYGTGISDALWSLWPRLHKMLMEWGIQVKKKASFSLKCRCVPMPVNLQVLIP